MSVSDIYFEDAAFTAAWRVFCDTDGAAADCLRAALVAAAPHLAPEPPASLPAAWRERARELLRGEL